ncbi:LysR family transcriptional regulator [Variovorax ureilyticus]|uniref:LysR family transcriptional regulator n=1 Tax=Variovorax ureilyticus TaxID=1836198 RepID=A0ABU8VP18_9BURK
MDQQKFDLNLLSLFEAIYRLRSVSQAADALGLSQPAASQGLARLRNSVGDTLFVRAGGTMHPTLRAERMASVIQPAVSAIQAVVARDSFDPKLLKMILRMQMSDIGEGRLLPALTSALHTEAPGICVETFPVHQSEVGAALDSGAIHFALGYLPNVEGTERVEVVHDRYVIVVRAQHPLYADSGRWLALQNLQSLEFAAVRWHDPTRWILRELGLEASIRLTTESFLALPGIIADTDLAAVMPRPLAMEFAGREQYEVLPVELPRASFAVSLHWSRRLENDLTHQWLRSTITRVLSQPQLKHRRHSAVAH